ncbi:MAG: serine protease [Cyanobacteria bacterium J06623_4]
MFKHLASSVVLCASISSALVISIPDPANALTGEEINDIARETTVLINSSSPGSGVIIARNGSVHYVLTAHHVVNTNETYFVKTSDKEEYEARNIIQLQGIDLAVVEFESGQKSYPTVTIATTNHVQEGQTVFVSGWPNPGSSIQTRIRQFTTGEISGLPEEPLHHGYQLVYTNVTRVGMSGGPVFDTSGRLIGIHGLAEGADTGEIAGSEPIIQSGNDDLVSTALSVGFNIGIPSNTFLSNAQSNNLYLGLDVEDSPPESLGAPYVPNEEVDPRDRIENINETIDLVGEGVEGVEDITDGIRNIFGF